MAYDFNARPFQDFDRAMRGFPDGVSDDRDTLYDLAQLYLDALIALLHLMLLIMRVRMSETERGARYRPFLDIYEDRVIALIEEMRDYLLGGLERGEIAEVRDFLEGTRRGAIARELAALGMAIEASSGHGDDAVADEEAGRTVTNSLKEHIERRVGRKWIKDILHAINEILSVARGVT